GAVHPTGNGGLRGVRRPSEHEGGQIEVVRPTLVVTVDTQRLARIVAVEPDPAVVAQWAEPGGTSRPGRGPEVNSVTSLNPQVERCRSPVPQSGQRQQSRIGPGRLPHRR